MNPTAAFSTSPATTRNESSAVVLESYEAEVLERKASALKTIAEAERSFAEAEAKRQETALAAAQAEHGLEERNTRLAKLLQQLEDAISIIRQKGGDVSISLEESAEHLSQEAEEKVTEKEYRS